MICKTYRSKFVTKKRDKGECLSCPSPALPGKTRCAKCRAKRGIGQQCAECLVETPVTNGYLCPGCVRLMANDSLRKKLHSRCLNDGELDLDSDIVKNAEYQAARSLRVGGQMLLPGIVKVPLVPTPEPYEAPVYSVGVFMDSLNWEG